MKKKNKSPFAWPFSKHRQMGIGQGDGLCADAETMIDGVDPSCATQGTSNWRHYRRAGRFFERAGVVYLRVGMNALAKKAYDRAADCWLIVGDEDLLRSAEQASFEIDVYWSEEEGE